MGEEEKEALSKVLGEALLYTEFRNNYDAFCQADWFSGCDTFADRMEAAGLIEVRSVTDDDLERPFAEELGIEPGGNVWDLTEKGRLVLAHSPHA